MKRKLFIILSLAMLVGEVFAMENVATTYQTNLKPSDMVEIFVEELNKSNYAYQIADYRVYTKPEEQNYAWAVKIGNEGYDYNNGRTHVHERSIYLFMKNGYVCFKTFGGPTTSNMKDCIDVNNEDFSKIRDSVYDSIDSYIRKSKTWLRRYNKSYSEDELEALNKLYCVTRGMFDFIINEYNFNGKYDVLIEDSAIGSCVKYLTWEVSWNQDEELLEFCKRRNCSLYLVFNEDCVDPKTIKKAELKKLKKEKQELLCYNVKTYKLYKVQNDEVVGTTLYSKTFLNIDDMLSGGSGYKGRCYQYVDKSENIIYQRFFE